jgi:hypothetical protein
MGWDGPRYTEQEVRDAVAGSRSLSDALRRLGLRAAGSNFRTLKRLIGRYDISTDHMDPNWVLRGNRPNRKIPLERIVVEGSSTVATNSNDGSTRPGSRSGDASCAARMRSGMDAECR